MSNKSPESQDKWCQLFDELNHHIMRENEWELGFPPKAIDFENMGQFPERIGSFFDSFSHALQSIGIRLGGAGFTILPYHSDSGVEVEPAVFLWSPKKETRRIYTTVRGDSAVCSSIAAEMFKQAATEGGASAGQLLHVPYFVKPITVRTKEQYQVEDVIHFSPRVYSAEAVDCSWLNEHTIRGYVQRFLLTLLVGPDENLSFLTVDGGKRLNHMIGAFLSWIGVAADEITNFQAARVASFQLLRSHQLGNEMTEVFFEFERQVANFLDKARLDPSLAQLEQVPRILRTFQVKAQNLRGKVASFTQVASMIGAPRENFAWYPTLTACIEAFGARTSEDDNIYLTEGSGRFQTPSRFDLSGIEEAAKDAHIGFSLYHFQELIENLYKNAKRQWQDDKRHDSQTFRVTARLVNGHMELSLANQGTPILDSLRVKLFRYPVPKEAQASKGTGVGLWALGMAFKTFGLQLPRVENEPGFGPSFIFRFPAKRRPKL